MTPCLILPLHKPLLPHAQKRLLLHSLLPSTQPRKSSPRWSRFDGISLPVSPGPTIFRRQQLNMMLLSDLQIVDQVVQIQKFLLIQYPPENPSITLWRHVDCVWFRMRKSRRRINKMRDKIRTGKAPVTSFGVWWMRFLQCPMGGSSTRMSMIL